MNPIDTSTGKQSGSEVYGANPDACYGMTCPVRGQCELHRQIGMPGKDGSVIVNCRSRGNEWPLFRQRAK